MKALVDTGCDQSVITNEIVTQLGLESTGPQRVVTMLNGHRTRCEGEVMVGI